MPGRLAAADAPSTWSNGLLKLEPEKIGLKGSPTQVKRIFAPQRAKGEVVRGEGDAQPEALRRIVEKLVAWDIVRMQKNS